MPLYSPPLGNEMIDLILTWLSRQSKDSGDRMTETNEYKTQWNDYRKRSRIVFALFLGYIPGVFILGFPLTKLLKSEIPFYIVALTWMATTVGAWIHLILFRCPRCRERFMMNKYFVVASGRKCPYCGLKKYDGKTA